MQEMQEMWIWSLGQEDPLEKEWITHSSILAWKSHEQGSLAGYSPWGPSESDTAEQLHFIYIYINIMEYFSYEKEWNIAICSNVQGPREYYA